MWRCHVRESKQTHSGRVRRRVNGEGGFCSLTGVPPFHADATGVIAGMDSDPDLLAGPLLECRLDVRGVVVGGAAEDGSGRVKAPARCFQSPNKRPPDA